MVEEGEIGLGVIEGLRGVEEADEETWLDMRTSSDLYLHFRSVLI